LSLASGINQLPHMFLMDAELKAAETADDYIHLILIGRLDVDGAGAIEHQIAAHAAARRHHLLVDMSGVSFLGSMGLRVLLVAAKALSRDGKILVLFNAQDSTRTTLTMAFGNVLRLVSDYVAALDLKQWIAAARRL
jgi:anti-anti-sigma factor